MVGGPFTWRGGQNNQSSRLDYFLVSEGWESHFRGLTQSYTLKKTIKGKTQTLY